MQARCDPDVKPDARPDATRRDHESKRETRLQSLGRHPTLWAVRASTRVAGGRSSTGCARQPGTNHQWRSHQWIGEAISGEAISGSEKPPVEKPATSGGKKLKPTTGGIATSGTARQHTVAAAKAAVQGSTQLQQQPRQHAAAAAWQRTTAAAWQHTTAAAWQHTAAATRQQHYAQRSKHRS